MFRKFGSTCLALLEVINTVLSTNDVVKGTFPLNCGMAQGEEQSQADLY